MLRFILLTSLVFLSSLTGRSWASSQVQAAAEISSGLSYKGDPATANSNSAISSNPTLKTAVTSGDDLLTGNFVLIGSFNLTDSQIQANAQNIPFLLSPSNFIQYGSAVIGDGYPGTNGVFTKKLNGDASAIVGKQIYVLVIAATNNATLSSAVSTAFQLGVYYEALLSNANWQFPAEITVPTSTVIDLADLTVNSGTALDSGAHVVVGSFGPDLNNSTGVGAKNFSLASVPEPSAGILLLVAAVGLVATSRCRRRDMRPLGDEA